MFICFNLTDGTTISLLNNRIDSFYSTTKGITTIAYCHLDGTVKEYDVTADIDIVRTKLNISLGGIIIKN